MLSEVSSNLERKEWSMRRTETLLFAIFSLLPLRPITAAQTTNAEIGFSRIVSGWTNYSTVFYATDDLAPNGDYATVASFYTPTNDVLPIEYGVIVIWNDSGGQRLNFTNFDFQICFWSGLQAFTNDPAQGDVATFSFLAPTGGSTTIPNATTRGGRPAYQIRFCLTNAPFVLNQGNTYLVGVSARTARRMWVFAQAWLRREMESLDESTSLPDT